MPTVTDYLKYANLQMAAEAFMNDTKTGKKDYSGTELKDALITGNKHASKFTPTQAADFSTYWKVLEQCPNTASGFSGTLFECVEDDPATGANKGELVLSFRSTEFVDDAVNDCQTTNKTIKNYGWGFGQIADMEAWYDKLTRDPALLGSNAYSVTGYSLGGHLATAFNLLRQNQRGQARIS